MSEFIDPRAFGLLQAGSAMLAGSGPSRYPQRLGTIMGGAAQQGLNGFLQARQANAAEQLRSAQLAEIQRKTKQEAEAAEMQRLIRGALFPELFAAAPGGPAGGPSGAAPINGGLYPQPAGLLSAGPQPVGGGLLYNDPDKIERLGTYLAMTGNAGGAGMLNTADRLRKRQEEAGAVDAMRSRPGVLGAGVTTNSPQGQAMLSNLTGDPEFDRAVVEAQNEALNSNTRLAPQAVQPARPGIYDPLRASPYVGATAQSLQRQLDDTRGVSPQQVLTQFNALQQQHMTASNQAEARRETGELRRDLAGRDADLRRELEGIRSDARAGQARATGEQRTFGREHTLAEDYNRVVRETGFRKMLPHFQASTKYMADGKFDSSGDRALVFGYAKLLDPMDRVGVNDLRDINKLGSVPERIVQAVAGLVEGKELPPRVRQEMFGVMRSRFEAMHQQQILIEDEYEERARRNMLNPSNVVIRHSERRQNSPRPKPRPGASDGWSIEPVR